MQYGKSSVGLYEASVNNIENGIDVKDIGNVNTFDGFIPIGFDHWN